MHIQKIIDQHRRDFRAVFVCEHCDHSEEKSGYDDANFHNNVIPAMVCSQCGQSASQDYRALTTKYPEHQVV